MHTAVQLTTSRFALSVDGRTATLDDVLPDWGRADRFGLVVREPLDGIGASLLLQLTIAAFYDFDPGRPRHVYPEVYVFHVGGLRSSYAWYDVFPPRKEVEVPDDPAVLLDAINDRGITRLAVPDGPPRPFRAHHQEPATARDRIRSAFAYSPTGRVDRADVSVAARHSELEDNTRILLDPAGTEDLQQYLFGVIPGLEEGEDAIPPELPAVPESVRTVANSHRSRISSSGLPTETYRRISTSEAIEMLSTRPGG